jgi:hypothetical protein
MDPVAVAMAGLSGDSGIDSAAVEAAEEVAAKKGREILAA